METSFGSEARIAVRAETIRGKNVTDLSDTEKRIIINNFTKKPPISRSIILQLKRAAMQRKKQRLTLFNSLNGILLRLAVDGDVIDTGEDLHFALCGTKHRISRRAEAKEGATRQF